MSKERKLLPLIILLGSPLFLIILLCLTVIQFEKYKKSRHKEEIINIMEPEPYKNIFEYIFGIF